ncbi:hypothetical protein BASA61_003054 [Batrachochytrium salamandrivorans]|nr:hypothetical protein BASA61_003054 [Batrachochytrium salamandrivorans]
MMGLDDLRQWTIGNEERRIQKKVDVYPNAETMRLFLERSHTWSTRLKQQAVEMFLLSSFTLSIAALMDLAHF